MPITIYTGKPGSGKTAGLAKKLLEVAERNVRWKKKTGKTRFIYSNTKITKKYEEKYKDFLKYWSEPRELTPLLDSDVFWDEMPAHLDATAWADMSFELKRWLQQHRKRGVEIWGTAQSFSQVDISARRLVSTLKWLSKKMGSPDPSPTSPPLKHIWGWGIARDVDPIDFDEDKPTFIGLPSFYLISRSLCETFDTRQDITVGEYPPMRHMFRVCERPGCKFVRVTHR